jgi:hypothetical protein
MMLGESLSHCCGLEVEEAAEDLKISPRQESAIGAMPSLSGGLR